MDIGIDISSVAYGTGVSNYTLNLVRNLIKVDKTNNYKLFFSSLRLPLPPEIKLIAKSKNVRIYHYRFPPTLLEILWNRLHILPIELFIGPCDIFHTSDWTHPPTTKAKTVTTVHDMTPFLYPGWLHQTIVTAHQNKFKKALKYCHHYICVSQSTRKDLLKIFLTINPKDTTVIHEAAEDKYDRFLKLKPAQQEKKKSTIYKQYGLSRYVLAQGTREPRKNLDRLVQAFCQFKKKFPTCTTELAIAGKYGWGEDVATPNRSIKILGYIPEKDMVALHASATCLVYPSLYEGFGLPILKSMKVGVPVITSNVSSMPEIVGDAAILVNPSSTAEITKALEKIIKSPTFRKTLSQKSILQSQKFSWTNTANQTLAVYQSLTK